MNFPSRLKGASPPMTRSDNAQKVSGHFAVFCFPSRSRTPGIVGALDSDAIRPHTNERLAGFWRAFSAKAASVRIRDTVRTPCVSVSIPDCRLSSVFLPCRQLARCELSLSPTEPCGTSTSLDHRVRFVFVFRFCQGTDDFL